MSDNDNVIQFPIQDNSKGPYRFVEVALISAAQTALDKCMVDEKLNGTDIINRALQLYSTFQTMIGQLNRRDEISGIHTDASGARFRITVQKVSD